MEVAATLKNSHVSAQKCRLVANQIRTYPVERALQYLEFSQKKSAAIIKKVLESAIANAEHNAGADIDELRVAEIYVNEGSRYKRFRARAKGRANRIIKRASHITVVVAD